MKKKKDKQYYITGSNSKFSIPSKMIGKTLTVGQKEVKVKQKGYWWKEVKDEE